MGRPEMPETSAADDFGDIDVDVDVDVDVDSSDPRVVLALVPDALFGERLDRVVAVIAEVTRVEAASLVDEGRVSVNSVVQTTRSRKVKTNDEIAVHRHDIALDVVLEPDPTVEFEVVHADDHVIVVNKPAELVVHPGAGNQRGTLVHGLIARFPELAAMASGDQLERPGIVHRLDKGTSGLLMVGRTPEAVRNLIAQLANRTVSRHYHALAWGTFISSSGLIDARVGRSLSDPTRMAVSSSGREARTRYSVLSAFTQPDPTTLVECWLETGRTHQIRVHLSAIGHPIVGDQRYGGARGAVVSPRPWLHAYSLRFDHPATGEEMFFTAEVPSDLTNVLTGLS